MDRVSGFRYDNRKEGVNMNKRFSGAGILTLAACSFLLFSGCGGARDDSVIRIGGIFPLSGEVAVYGVDCRNGVELALSEINAAGGVNGRQLVLIAEDDEGNPEKSVNAYKKLVTRDRVNVIIGSLTSGCTAAVAALAQNQGILQIAPAATGPAITRIGDYIFRACFTDPFQGRVCGRFVTETLGFRNTAVLYDISNDYSSGLYENFKAAVEAAGGTVTAESYSTGDKDFYAQITKIKSVSPEVVYLPDYYSTVALVAKQLRNSGVNVPLVGSDGWDGVTSNAGDEVLNSYYSTHYASDSDNPKVQTFVAAYEAAYNAKPTFGGALGYDCVYMLRDALAKTEDPSDTRALRDAFQATDGSYVTGNLRFDGERNPVKTVTMLEIVKDDSGALTTVYKTSIEPDA